MAGRPELAGAGGLEASGHGFQIRTHTEREEGNANPTRGITRPEGRLARGPTVAPWPAPTVLLRRPLEALKIKENGTGKKREVLRAHHDEERELRRLETTASRGGRQTPATASLRRAERSEDREKETGKGGKEGSGARGYSPTKTEARGMERGGSGGRGLAVLSNRARARGSGVGGWR